MEHIKEVIVVEGKDDESAVKAAVKCEVIITHGYGIRASTFSQIKKAAASVGVIIFTDPDFAGEQIRKRISKAVKGCKHAFLSREDATRADDIGIENASPENIIKALKKVRTLREDAEPLFDQNDLVQNGLIGTQSASDRRAVVGERLGIGFCNGKQFLNRLNHYGVTREEFEEAISAIERE